MHFLGNYKTYFIMPSPVFVSASSRQCQLYCQFHLRRRGQTRAGFFVCLFYKHSFIFIFLFISFHKFVGFLFLAVLGLRCCARAFSSCSEWGLLFVAVLGLLMVAASVVAEHGLQARGLQSLWHVGAVMWLPGSRAQAQQMYHTGLVAPRGMWHLPGTGIKPVSPA